MIYLGMKNLCYTEKEVFSMTFRKFHLLYDEFLELNGLKEKLASVHDLP